MAPSTGPDIPGLNRKDLLWSTNSTKMRVKTINFEIARASVALV